MKLHLPQEQVASFSHIRSAFTNRPVTGTFPDFMILGPQRTGTTWLHRQLSLHPEIFLSFPKELYFFSQFPQTFARPGSRHFHNFDFRTFLRCGPARLTREITKIIYVDLIKTGRLPAWSLEWYLQFFKSSSSRWPARAIKFKHESMSPWHPMMFGEATASYAVLDESVIADITMINPALKAIISVRDPVDRAWSHAKKDLVKLPGRALKEIGEQAFFEFFSTPYQIRCADYVRQINLWGKYLAPGNLHICFYDEIQRNPVKALTDILRFLGINSAPQYLGHDLKTKINPTSPSPMPENIKSFLDNLLAGHRRALELMYTNEADRLPHSTP